MPEHLADALDDLVVLNTNHCVKPFQLGSFGHQSTSVFQSSGMVEGGQVIDRTGFGSTAPWNPRQNQALTPPA